MLAVALTVAGLAEAAYGLTSPAAPWWVLVTVPLVTLPVAVRRARPALAAGVLVAACLLQALLGSDLPGGLAEGIALVLVTYAVGAHLRLRPSVAVLAASGLGMAAVVLLGDDPRVGNLVYLAAVVTAAWTAGYAVRTTHERGELLAEQRLGAERSRIAGELHDAVAHHVSAIVVQAGAERRDLPAGSPTAEALAGIERQGRATLTELRTLLGVLHADDDLPLSPQPGIGQIADLVRDAAASGITVTVRSEGVPRAVAGPAGLTVYRVVQEALTNVRKHSAGRAATVSLRWHPDRVDVDVHDPGPTRRAPRFGPSGLGLRGMAERVRALGGTVDSGADGDGFRVRASVPAQQAGAAG